MRRCAGGYGPWAGPLPEARRRAATLRAPRTGRRIGQREAGRQADKQKCGRQVDKSQEDRLQLDQRQGSQRTARGTEGRTLVSYPHRLERLRAWLEAYRIDGLLISQPESRYYLSGYTGHDLPPRDSAGYLLITASQAMLLTDPRTAEQASNESPDFEVITYASGSRGPQAAAERAAQVGIRRLGFESIHLPYAIWEEIRRDLPASIEFVP
ncbi:MAG: hypothetical protein E6I75_24115, partial [Chloroflexi bacterium]